MAAAAVTAVIAPMALLSAPGAFAVEGAEPAESAPASDPTPDPKLDPAKKPTLPKPPADKPPTKAEEPGDPDEPENPEDPEEPGEPGDEPTEHGSEDEREPQPVDCPVNDKGVDPDSELEIDLAGLPGKIVAGSGWHRFELTATNPTAEAFGEVKWLVTVYNDLYSEDERDHVSTYSELQFIDPETKAWKSVDEFPAHGVIELGAEETVDIQLRLKVSADAPIGKAYATGVGHYVDSELDCTHNSADEDPLKILKPGSENKHPGTPKPTKKPTKKPSVVTQPQGGAKDLPVTGSLADTGSSSALPAIGLIGGAAVVIGAGAVFVVRRRKGDTAG
ncbi:LPXTG cell wall anchor domain-containing protein [Streptomyces alboniger]|uniref:LPXTG cell wall anchor domain-containing protein n=2 Tax=Streptomyces alboniger TaxID=132473 RepID=A0A5J6HKF3_STRAD|nr:LPXTG cell wall anchor domain-containing protein [Streptomyces alboniger]